MEPISAISLSLALGAGAVAGKEIVSALVKDAYAALKARIASRYPEVSVEQLEAAPQSKARRVVIEQDLTAAGAETDLDLDLVAAARELIELVKRDAPAAATAIGVDLQDVEAANLRLADITASGTGVKVEKGKFSGDIDIQGVRAGVAAGDPDKDA